MKNPYLLGERIYLRPIERDDGPTILPWINDPVVRRTLLHRGPLNMIHENDYIDRISRSEHDLALLIVRKTDDKPIGATGFHGIDFRNRHCQFGILIGDKESWGLGHGTEATRLMVDHAFSTMNLNRVWLHVYEDNERGIRAYTCVGFKKEGVLRQENFRDGRYWDTWVMGILRDEWKK
jgi:RimJ/RimL family protein N-acetyltransferase